MGCDNLLDLLPLSNNLIIHTILKNHSLIMNPFILWNILAVILLGMGKPQLEKIHYINFIIIMKN